GRRRVGRGKEGVGACLGFEAGGIRKGTRPGIEPLAQVAPRRRVNEGYRDRRGGVAAGKKDRMHRRAVLERALLARSVAAVKARAQARTPAPLTLVNAAINVSLRLTLYCRNPSGGPTGAVMISSIRSKAFAGGGRF